MQDEIEKINEHIDILLVYYYNQHIGMACLTMPYCMNVSDTET